MLCLLRDLPKATQIVLSWGCFLICLSPDPHSYPSVVIMESRMGEQEEKPTCVYTWGHFSKDRPKHLHESFPLLSDLIYLPTRSCTIPFYNEARPGLQG